MTENKRYYWLKLKEDFFQDEIIEWLEEQENGKDYVLFYLKLCLKSLKNNGVLIRQVGDMFIPYDIKKLAEITKTSVDTVIVALKVLTETGLIEVQENGELYLTQLRSMVGSESASPAAIKKRAYREKVKNFELLQMDNKETIKETSKRTTSGTIKGTEKGTNCPTEYRDKSLDKVVSCYNPISSNSVKVEVDSKALDITKTKANNKLTVEVDSKAYCKTLNNNNNNNIYKLWEENIYPVTAILVEKLDCLLQECGETAVRYGIEAAVEQGKRTLPYVRGCARNYLASGGRAKQKRKINDVEGTITQIQKEMDEGKFDIWDKWQN